MTWTPSMYTRDVRTCSACGITASAAVPEVSPSMRGRAYLVPTMLHGNEVFVCRDQPQCIKNQELKLPLPKPPPPKKSAQERNADAVTAHAVDVAALKEKEADRIKELKARATRLLKLKRSARVHRLDLHIEGCLFEDERGRWRCAKDCPVGNKSMRLQAHEKGKK